MDIRNIPIPKTSDLSRTQVPLTINPEVEKTIAWFMQGNGRPFMAKWLARSGKFFPKMKEIFREEGTPEELIYLSMIESGMNPTVVSKAQAVGLWQFIQGTGSMYGLKSNWWLDNRRDPWKATRAAARHLSDPVRGDGRIGGWAPGEPVPADAIRVGDDGVPVLTVLPSAATRALFSNVDLLTKSFQRDLASFSNIILDLPPVDNSASEGLNPVAAARAADAVFLVGLTGLTYRTEMAEASQKLRQVGANVTGVILNDQFCATLGEEIADVSYSRLGRAFPRIAHWIAQKALSIPYLGQNFRIVR